MKIEIRYIEKLETYVVSWDRSGAVGSSCSLTFAMEKFSNMLKDRLFILEEKNNLNKRDKLELIELEIDNVKQW